ncbi:MAG TPA: YggS family pyridoxal phosphate-dependent enzyme [Phycisphaerae bacterium]|nr:YggS family pyridoxal phosphate-dependent enzyme [Phycisphaerae bacterium]HRW54916.1 YggS family pyridoxal phosphate-dependent enzyme [Phycisphaerae bacterium]
MITKSTNLKRKLSENVKRVRDRIAAACDRGSRDPAGVNIVTVTKYVDMEVVRAAIEIGLVDIGESRPQQLNQRAGMLHELAERKAVLGGKDEIVRPRWHMIGHLQRNKVKMVVPWVELIHSVDSLRLAEDLHLQASKLGKRVDILLQVNTSGERTKHGVAVGAVTHLAEHFREWPGIRLCGLMTMAPLECTPDELRLYFNRLRDVFDDLRGERFVGPEFRHLSMGMSTDFDVAVECGATIIRLGSTLFEGVAAGHEIHDEIDA